MLNDSGGMETRLILGVICITVIHTHTAVDRLYSWVPLGWGQCHCQGMRHLFAFLQLMSSQRAITIELSKWTLLFLMVESFDQRQLGEAFLFVLWTFPSISEWLMFSSNFTLRFFAWCISLRLVSEGSIQDLFLRYILLVFRSLI